MKSQPLACQGIPSRFVFNAAFTKYLLFWALCSVLFCIISWALYKGHRRKVFNIIFVIPMRKLGQIVVWEYADSYILGSGKREVSYQADWPQDLWTAKGCSVWYICLDLPATEIVSFVASFPGDNWGKKRRAQWGFLRSVALKGPCQLDHWLFSKHSDSFTSCSYLEL